MSAQQDRVLAVDIGTSSVRAMAFDAAGRVSARAQLAYPTVRPAPYQEEQDPRLVRREVYAAIARCLAQPGAEPSTVRAIAFSSQMYGVFPVDAHDEPLANSMLWSDGRAEPQAERLKAERGALDLYRATGCPASGIFPVAKLAWLREERPELFAAARRFVSIKEYVTRPLVGEWVVDHSMASSTGMLDIRAHRWHPDALAVAGIAEGRLSRPTAGLEPFRVAPGSPLEGLGLDPGVRVFLGGGDGPLANLGSGAGTVGAVNVDLGTSGAARCIVDAPTTDERASLWCFCLTEDLWAYGGIVTNVGNAYAWLGSNLLAPSVPPEEAYALLNRLAGEAGPGAGGLHFLPFLRKARSPYWDGRLRGTMYGLTADHGQRHVARAFLEAVAFDLRAILDIMEDRIATQPRVVLTGGLARSPVLPGILADVLGRGIAVPDESEGSIGGAAILGLRGVGLVDGFRFAGGPPPGHIVSSDPGMAELYGRRYREHGRLVAALRALDLQGASPSGDAEGSVPPAASRRGPTGTRP
jgi:gluconokinase